jgi:hypothetical protein
VNQQVMTTKKQVMTANLLSTKEEEIPGQKEVQQKRYKLGPVPHFA